MKKFSVLMMVAFAIVFLSACTKPGTSVNTANSTNSQAQDQNTQKSVKEQIAKRNGAGENVQNNEQQGDTVKKEEQKQENMVKEAEDKNIDALASCLTEKGLKMFGTERCSHCQSQKKMFGDSFSKINFTDCDKEKEVCTDAGVQGYPTWADKEGNLFPGSQNLEKLAKLAGCEY